ncbi:Membrane protein involved in the export of O-antigen and teichoic acid [Mesorhizobium sp. NFR06]|uniref:lipopolysaccharide biosynthesis protein n=1 Tax=Mesorhizobium sp. NFR06 TaxID=1566290 RepID=UPI0008F0295D|nr:lipopolysaccharide biosynthesis protein [Mesorhizobium sp. NFR06]SFN88085.1 Membrane protein involved in the export of O-antigen and teichoic acid [Mesorhizobium sp. NFR06]
MSYSDFLRSREGRITASPIGKIVRAAGGVSAMAIAGQLTLVATIPILARLYSPADFGVFTIYLSTVNILGAVAALRFEPSLYGVKDTEQTYVTVKLILLAVLTTGALTFAAGQVLLSFAPVHLRALVWLVPIGMSGAALVEAMNCWALRAGLLRDFALGRLILPATMALLQLVFGLARLGGEAMVHAHVISQFIFLAFLGFRILTWDDVRGIYRAPWRSAFDKAVREYKFPLFDIPATLGSYAINNLPAILVGSLFGAAFAGYLGVATRLVTGPIVLIATPLSNVFVAEANKNSNRAHLLGIARGLVILAAGLTALPILALGLAAPYLVVPLLGEAWIPTAQIMTALAFMGAVQALSTPLGEVPALLRRQEVRLVVDAARMVLVFGPLLAGAKAGWEPIDVIYLMAAGGTVGFAIKTAASLYLLKRDTNAVQIPLPSPYAIARKEHHEAPIE